MEKWIEQENRSDRRVRKRKTGHEFKKVQGKIAVIVIASVAWQSPRGG